MPTIHLTTFIAAPPAICFHLSRSMELHQKSVAGTGEKAVAGTTTGLLNLDEWVTWEAVHFGIKQQLTSKISAYNFPNHFRDEQVKGAFRYFKHDHYFSPLASGTQMKDLFEFESPYGIFGRIFSILIINIIHERFSGAAQCVPKIGGRIGSVGSLPAGRNSMLKTVFFIPTPL